jgi:hypothetical protein
LDANLLLNSLSDPFPCLNVLGKIICYGSVEMSVSSRASTARGLSIPWILLLPLGKNIADHFSSCHVIAKLLELGSTVLICSK